MSTNTEYIHGLRFLALLLRILPAVIFAQKSEFFSSEHGHKLTNCYREIFLIQTAKKKEIQKANQGTTNWGVLGSTGYYVHGSTYFSLGNPSSQANMLGLLLLRRKFCVVSFFTLLQTQKLI